MQLLDVIELFEKIKLHYANFDTGKDKRESWLDFLKDVPAGVAWENLRRHIATEKFPPTTAELSRPLRAEKDFSARYHEGIKRSAEEHLANLDHFQATAVGPSLEQREKVREIFEKRGYGSPAASQPGS